MAVAILIAVGYRKERVKQSTVLGQGFDNRFAAVALVEEVLVHTESAVPLVAAEQRFDIGNSMQPAAADELGC